MTLWLGFVELHFNEEEADHVYKCVHDICLWHDTDRFKELSSSLLPFI